MRRYLQVPEPMGGEIFASQLHEDGAEVARSDHVRLGIETEIAVRLGRDLPPRAAPYGPEDVAPAISEVMAAIELVDDRYEDFAAIGAATLIADNAFDAGSVLGAPAPGWRDLDLGALLARTWRNGTVMAEGRSDALHGHPLRALAWLASRRASLGLGLAAGTFVSLGSITPVQWVTAPATYRIEVEALGTVTVTIV
jgi:2-keto-4-pentenoate hydratase